MSCLRTAVTVDSNEEKFRKNRQNNMAMAVSNFLSFSLENRSPVMFLWPLEVSINLDPFSRFCMTKPRTRLIDRLTRHDTEAAIDAIDIIDTIRPNNHHKQVSPYTTNVQHCTWPICSA